MANIENIYRKKNSNENSKGGAIVTGAGQGALSGAAIGSGILPSWGTAIGAVVGGLAGGLGANNQFEKEQEAENMMNREQELKRKALEMQQMNSDNQDVLSFNSGINSNMLVGNPYNSYQGNSSTVPYAAGQYAMGGQLNEFNGGGTHQENPIGGIPVGNGNSVESGETELTSENYVFSDRILINSQLQKEYNLPKNVVGKSFAEYSKKINKKYSHREGDKMDEDSKKMELDRLMDAQESFKRVEMPQQHQVDPMTMQQMMQLQDSIPQNQPQVPQQMAMGGYRTQPSYKKAYGDPPPLDIRSLKSEELQNFIDLGIVTHDGSNSRLNGNRSNSYTIDTDLYNNWYSKNSPEDATSDINGGSAGSRAMPGDEIKAATNGALDPPPPNNMPLLKGAEYVGALAPLAYNLYQSIKPYDKLKSSDYYVNADKLEPATLNIDPILRKNNETFAAQRNAIKSASGGSAGTYLANIAQAQLNRQKGDADAYIAKENYDDRSKMQADQFNIQTGLNTASSNRQMDYRVGHDNLRSKAQRDHHLGAATLQGQQIANLYAQNRFDKATADKLIEAGYAKNAAEAHLILSNPALMQKTLGQ